MGHEDHVVRACCGNDHAISRVAVECRRETVNCDDGLGVQRQDRKDVGSRRATQPHGKRKRQADSIFGMEHLCFPSSPGKAYGSKVKMSALSKVQMSALGGLTGSLSWPF
jgi:hypothetical protein